MSGIICAIRGGPASRPTIDKAIALAKETQQTIYFLFVVNLDFLRFTSSSRTKSIAENMHEMGEFILLTAQNQVTDRGVSAEGLVRHGNVGEEIITLSGELEAEYVVLGRPRGELESNVFSLEHFQEFVQHIESASEAKVVLAEE
jgi:nucleotide-binding universal stress UspA family protein